MKTEQKEKKQYGDYVTLADIMGITTDAARMRYRRGDKEALKAMDAIKENRRKLIETYKNQKI